MSELTRCNYCTLKDIKRKAKKEGKKVIVKRGKHNFEDSFMGPGIDVFIDDKKTAWFMELTNHCVC